VAALGAGGNAQVLLLRELAGLHDLFHSLTIDRARLLDKRILARFNRRLEMQRTKMRRRGENDIVNFRNGQQLLIGIESGEAHLIRDRHVALLQLPAAGIEPIGKDIRQGNHFDISIRSGRGLFNVLRVVARIGILDVSRGSQGVRSRAGSASATANQADADRIVWCGMNGGDERELT